MLFRKACFLYKKLKIVFSRFTFSIYDMGITGLQGVTGGYRVLQGVTRGYKGLQGVRRDDKGLQEVTMDYRTFF